MKKFFWRFMLVLVVAEVAWLAFAWNQSYTRAYAYEAITSNNICGCAGMFQFDSRQVLIDETWVVPLNGDEPMLQEVWGHYPTDCWHSRAVNTAWNDAIMPILRILGVNTWISLAAFIVWIYRDKDKHPRVE